MSKKVMFICGGNYTLLQDRGDCPNPLHDYPLPDGYGEASDVAAARIRNRWSNRRCPDCKLYGWAPGRITDSTNAVKVEREEPSDDDTPEH
jgi:hypothetical protein